MPKVYAMREVYVIPFLMFPPPFLPQKKKTKEQKRPARKETTVSRRAPPCSLPAITLTVKSEETVAAASILKFQQPIARSPSSLPRASPTSKLKIGTEKPTNEERGEGREGGGRRRNSLHPRRSSFPRPHTNSKSCSN